MAPRSATVSAQLNVSELTSNSAAPLLILIPLLVGSKNVPSTFSLSRSSPKRRACLSLRDKHLG